MEEKLAKNRTLNIILSVSLTFFMTGLGQIACGKIKRGILIHLISIVLFIAAAFIVLQPFPLVNIIAASLISGSIFLFALVDSIRIAKNPENTLKLKPVIGYSLLVVILLVDSSFIQPVISKTIKDNYVQAFKIPNGSMIPSLLIGDHLLVNKQAYKNNGPKRGDIVVFEFPEDASKTFIKRVVGIGGDVVELKDKQLYIKGTKVEEHFTQHLGPTKDQSEMLDKLTNFGPVTVPQDSVFTLGDNRDRSYDSRFWGPVKRQKVKGKAATIYWSWDKENSRVRWDRIGKLIN